MQLLAMLTMLIDHIGAVWFPDDAVWRIVGRLAFPLYAYAIVIGYFRTRNLNRYLLRMALLAGLSQIPYMLAFRVWEVNAIATLFVCLLMLTLLDRYREQRPLQLLLSAAALAMLELIPFDYGAYALLLVYIFRYAKPGHIVWLHLGLNVLSVVTKGWGLQLFSMFASLLIFYLPDFLRAMDRVRVPRMLWRSFYPLHLALIAIAWRMLS
ncbi:TraX family protein [Paenibacillus sp. LHD-117]|uniref:TraX family protein n=1 Tax=Paenibacillus sp. LHD-117 TaxID=3071412 RepID=UPI0027E11964|nr:TraX family protein [Paenibacillus sp. LHD-117]MDQ6423183.1 TraX family protein [Paenibacillus sp. LHD-117]